MNRYFVYLMLMNMLVNVVSYVPGILIEKRFDGALTSILLAIVISTILIFLFTSSLQKFPGHTLPDLLEEFTPSWFRIPFSFFLTVMWYIAGVITLLNFVHLTVTFLDPDISIYLISGLFLAIILAITLLRTDKLLYNLELLLWLNIPIIAIIFFTMLVSRHMDWDAVTTVAVHSLDLPNLDTLAASTYAFSGYTNLIIFHKVLSGNIRPLFIPLISIAGIINLATSFLIPVGFQGADGVGDFIYPWLTTTDSISIEFGFVERVMFLFLLLYISISILSVSVRWHVSLQISKTIFPAIRLRNLSINRVVFAACMIGITLYLQFTLSESTLFQFARIWLSIRFLSEIFLVTLVVIFAWRKK